MDSDTTSTSCTTSNDDVRTLLQYGVVSKVPIVSSDISSQQWLEYADEYSKVSPEIMFSEGEGTYAFYRNILNEPNFPFDRILYQKAKRSKMRQPLSTQVQNEEQHIEQRTKHNSNKNVRSPHRENQDLETTSVDPENPKENNDDDEIVLLPTALGDAILNYFPSVGALDEIRLDDAFCIHYNMNQTDTTGSKHMDPSDITVNICIAKSSDCVGSKVVFYGTKQLNLLNVTISDDPNGMKGETKSVAKEGCEIVNVSDTVDQFIVNQEAGYATIHYGNHPHETTKLESGYRTNIILTYCYTDSSRSDVTMRTCYM